MALKESFGSIRNRFSPLTEKLASKNKSVEQSKKGDELDKARHTLIDTSEAIRTGERSPEPRTLQELTRTAFFLASSDLIRPVVAADTLAITHANLHAVNADTTPLGREIAQLSDTLLEKAHDQADTNPRIRIELEAIRAAIEHTTPTHSFESAVEEAWPVVAQKEGWVLNRDGAWVARSSLDPSATGAYHPADVD